MHLNNNDELVLTDNDIERCNVRADEIVDDLKETCEEENIDPVGVMFALFVHAIHCLVVSGWSIEDLQKEVNAHGKMELTDQSFEQ